MFVKQIDMEKALELAAKGMEIKVLAPICLLYTSIPRKHQVFQKVIAYLGVTIGELMKQGGENDDTQENNKRKWTDS